MVVTPTMEEFLSLPDEKVFDLIHPKKLNMSLLLNGTRRLYMYLNFESPPTDEKYHVAMLQMIIEKMVDILKLLAAHGIYRVFLPVYSEAQTKRDPVAHQYLIKGIESLYFAPVLMAMYNEVDYGVRFTGDLSFLPETTQKKMNDLADNCKANKNKHFLFYDMNAENSHDYILKLGCEFMQKHNRIPTRDDILEVYYKDRTIGDLNIFITANRFYARSMPPLLSGHSDRIYATVTSPLVMTRLALRKILYDYLFSIPPIGVNYRHVSEKDFKRLKLLYDHNRDTVMGLTCRFDDLVFPYDELDWPKEMENP